MNSDPNQTSTIFKGGDRLFGNWQESKWCPEISHHNAPPLTHDHYYSVVPLYV